jgi:hypothetical protein
MYRRHSYNLYYAAFASDRLGKGTSDNRYFVALDWGHSLVDMRFFIRRWCRSHDGLGACDDDPSFLARALFRSLIFWLPSHAQDADNRLNGSGDGCIRSKFGTLQGRFG